MLLVVETNQSRLRIAEAARTRLFKKGEPVAAERQTDAEEGYIAQHATVALAEGESLTVEKVVALHTGRDKAISEPALAAVQTVAAAGDFEALFAGSRARLAPALGSLRHQAQGFASHPDDPAPAHLPPAADRVAALLRARRRRAGARPAWRGLSRPHLLGRGVHPAVPEFPHAGDLARRFCSTAIGGCRRRARRPGRAG